MGLIYKNSNRLSDVSRDLLSKAGIEIVGFTTGTIWDESTYGDMIIVKEYPVLLIRKHRDLSVTKTLKLAKQLFRSNGDDIAVKVMTTQRRIA